MSSTLNSIMMFVEGMDYSNKQKEIIETHLPTLIKNMEEGIDEEDSEELQGLKTYLSYTLLNACIKMHDYYLKGQIDALTEVTTKKNE